MKKKLVSLLLAGSVVASMAAIASVSASAIIDDNGCYAPGDNVEATYRYYFAMPKAWYTDNAKTAGIYWWSGTDACGAVDGTGGSVSWPGYLAQKSDVEDVYYVDCPTDVPTIIWNNSLDGGQDKEDPKYLEATQTTNIGVEFYSDGDSDLYDTDWFAEMEESYNGDKAALGDFADNFFMDDEYGFSFNFDNMIYIVDLNKTDVTFEGKMTYTGELYFYYGNGEYGTYPTKEESTKKGTLGNVADAPATPDQPTTTAPSNVDPTNNNNKPGQPSTDPASSTKPVSTSDTPASTVSGGAVQTGEASYAVILLVVLAAVSGVVVFTRKKYN
ncbi:hypothetical protein [Ruminococcus sp.]|uniref:hypothetical protein n=1 Tax=Ruminococcus sp. TaxID=41978 RepID=UPI0026367740|nr:hypothetical protein [Ruminococcus sp.]MDD6989077.1 hypothetical protein [Ruminococcus sp.]MDY6200946.1 hypothetical protein [Ruminococcus sp.]